MLTFAFLVCAARLTVLAPTNEAFGKLLVKLNVTAPELLGNTALLTKARVLPHC
jgi:uncharacterized surface protein with fasciclin (FAS1) repeats